MYVHIVCCFLYFSLQMVINMIYSGGLANLIQIDFGGTCLPVRSPSMLTSPSFSTSSSKVISKNLTNSLLILWDDNHCESLYIDIT